MNVIVETTPRFQLQSRDFNFVQNETLSMNEICIACAIRVEMSLNLLTLKEKEQYS
jgi:hypothetical protein